MATKRAPNAYALYAQEQTPIIKEQHPDWTFVECSRHIAIKWKGLNETQKNVYKQKSDSYKPKAQNDKSPIAPKNTNTKKSGTNTNKVDTASSSSVSVADESKQNINKIKRPMNAYMHFQQDYRKQLKQQNPNLTFAEIGSESSKKWKELSEDKRQKYVDLSNNEKAKYNQCKK